MVKIEESTLKTQRGETLYTRRWIPESEEVKALLFICHGYGEHVHSNYEEFADFCASRGIFVFTHDHVGHGTSSGTRVQISSAAEYVDPVIEHCQSVISDFSKEEATLSSTLSPPLFILGHSMGGLITLLATFENESLFNGGVILMGPLIEVGPEIATPLNVFLAKVGKFIAPGFQVSSIGPEKITRDRNMIKALTEDPLHWHGGLKLKHGYVLLEELAKLNNNFPNIKLPVFIQQGEKDPVVTPKGAQTLFDSISSEEKEIKYYPGAFHHLFIEIEDIRKEAIRDAYEWIDKICSKKHRD